MNSMINNQRKQIISSNSKSRKTLSTNKNDNLLENSVVVETFDVLTSLQQVNMQTSKNTSNIPLTKSSLRQRRLSIKPNNTRKQVIINDNNRNKIVSPIVNTKIEKKSQSELIELNKQTDIIDQNESLNGTINSEFQTTVSKPNIIDKTEFNNKKSIENQATYDLLTKIQQSAKPIPIGPMPLSQQACRFELPFDLKLLETLTPLDYLSKYCRISPRRQYQFKRIFDKYRNRQYRFESSDLYLSIADIHKENLTQKKYEYLCQLIDLNNKQYQFTFDTYAGILALCERILYNTSTLYDDQDDYFLAKDAIERCDFDSLSRKLDGLIVSDTMKKLLNAL